MSTIPVNVTQSAEKAIHLRSIALPAQHGIWGFWLEPSLAALIATPSWAGLCLAQAGLALLLLHHPLTMWLKDRRRGKTYARTVWAGRFTALFGGAAAIFLVTALLLGNTSFVAALGLALPFALIQVLHELRNQGRSLVAEVSGAAALAALAPAIVNVGGGTLATALGIWTVILVRMLVSIPYIRTRLLLEKGKPTRTTPALALHVIGVLALALLAAWGHLPWMAVIGGFVLLARALGGLTSLRKAAPARILGFREIAYGIAVAVLAGVGFRL